MQSVDELEILRKEKPENIIEEGITMEILPEEKEPLSIEYCDILSIIVEPKLKSKPMPEISERDAFEILPKPKEPLQTENIDEIMIEGKTRQKMKCK